MFDILILVSKQQIIFSCITLAFIICSVMLVSLKKDDLLEVETVISSIGLSAIITILISIGVFLFFPSIFGFLEDSYTQSPFEAYEEFSKNNLADNISVLEGTKFLQKRQVFDYRITSKKISDEELKRIEEFISYCEGFNVFCTFSQKDKIYFVSKDTHISKYTFIRENLKKETIFYTNELNYISNYNSYKKISGGNRK